MKTINDVQDRELFEPRDGIAGPHVFLQWKGTDVCLDFHCRCGALGHFDGYHAYYVRCMRCGTVWQLPTSLIPREITADPATLGNKPCELTYEF